MILEGKHSLAELERLITRLLEIFPYDADDFDGDGYLTDVAALRVVSAIAKVLVKKAHEVVGAHAFEEYVNACLDDMVAIGALECLPSKNGKPTYRRLRDLSSEGSECVAARAEARIKAKASECRRVQTEAQKRRVQ
jgi:hypothetical protein